MNILRRLILIVAVVGSILHACPLIAQTQYSENTLKRTPDAAGRNDVGPKAKISDVKWISGHWRGEAMGGRFEETWNPPFAGSMVGMFKFAKDEEVGFYELLTIVEHENSLMLRLKHFHNDLKGWEEKDKSVEFPLVKLNRNEANFDGLTFRKIDENTLHVFVVAGKSEEKPSELKFVAKRAAKKN